MSWEACNLNKKIKAESSIMPVFVDMNLKHRETRCFACWGTTGVR